MSGLFEAAIGAVAGHFVGEKVKDMVGKGKEKLATAKTESPKKESGNSVFDWLKEQFETKDEAEKIREEAQKERAGIFKSVATSVAERYCPTFMKIWDAGKTLTSAVGITERGAEIHPLQHEIETITAFSFFVPGVFLKHLTEPLRKSETFQKLVEHWPMLNQSWVDKMKAETCKPDDVVSVLRIMNQDMVTGKATFDKVSGFFMGKNREEKIQTESEASKVQSKPAANDNAQKVTSHVDAPLETKEAA